MSYDLILSGGHVIDPANGRDGVMDVAVKGGRIAAVGAGLPGEATKTIDAAGMTVTPGLLDIHVHVYGGYAGWMFPDVHSFTSGVTTVVDTGGPGWKSFEDFKTTIIDKSKTRVLSLLNIVGAGMLGAVENDVAEMDAAACAEMIRAHPELIVGSKTAHFAGPGWEAVDGALRAAELSDTVCMIDFWPRPTRTYPELLARMRPGDIHTHVYAQHIPLLDDEKRVQDFMWQARERGVVFDLGHGAGSFWWRQAIPAMRQGFPPDTISTDLHKNSALIPNANMITTMSKCLNMGMPMTEVIQRSTVEPAAAIRRPDLGTLSVGAEADIAVLDVRRGDFGFVDSGRARHRGDRRLECMMTVRAGEIVWDVNGMSWPDWEDAGEYAVIR
jgi:dihydroorotase